MNRLDDIHSEPDNVFERAAQEQYDDSILMEFWSFLKYNKKWWMLPILLVLFLFGFLIYLAGTAVAPFIYTLF